ncbi:hypothetical protein GCM10027020_05680 [Nocardioides salsibiostraticola]
MASTQLSSPSAHSDSQLPGVASQQLRWLALGLVLGFLVPFVFADVLDLSRDLYYGIYAAFVLTFFALWARATDQQVGTMLRRRWPLAVTLGVVFAGVLAVVVIRTDAATARPEGLELAWALLWRGVMYGAMDALLLSVFPILAVFAAASGSRLRTHLIGQVAVVAAAMLASLVMTATYHVGYSDFRSDKVVKPLIGNVMWSVPTLVTLNPIGSVISHTALHVTAVLHNPDTDTFLPPHGRTTP